MNALLLTVLLARQAAPPAPVAGNAAPQAGSEPETRVEPWLGTLSAARTELQRLSNAGEHNQAITLGSRMLAMPTWSEVSEERRAAALFDLGVALGNARAVEPAAEAFHKARGLVGSQPLGLDAIYDAGTYRLHGAEELRLAIPELREKLGLQPLPPAGPQASPAGPSIPAPGATPAPQEQPDPIAVARQAYLGARTDLIDRWHCDARDRDTRANLELVQRRLRELDELEKQREEQQQDEQQQNQDDQQKDKQDPGQEQQQQDQQQDPQDQQDQQGEEQPKQDQEQQQPKPDDQESKDQKQAQPDPKDMREEKLSPEEVMRLLDQLQKIEEQAEQVRAQMRERRRVPVKKDW